MGGSLGSTGSLEATQDIRKRKAQHPPISEGDIYISRKTPMWTRE
jgi:hypothetical protein